VRCSEMPPESSCAQKNAALPSRKKRRLNHSRSGC
jgi:hypothetical protein